MSDETTGTPADGPHVVVLPHAGTPDGPGPADGGGRAGVGTAGREDLGSMVEQPAKVMRIGTMVKQLLDEVRAAPLDDAARARLAEIHERSLDELRDGLSDELVEELQRITLPFVGDDAPSDAELRIAQAQLVGWLEGLFHGLQTAIVAQQVAAQQQLAQMRRALPPGVGPGGPGGPQRGTVLPVGGAVPGEAPDERPGPGQYL